MASIPQIPHRAPALATPRFGGVRGVSRTLLAGLALLVLAAVGLFQVLQTSRAATAGYDLRAMERERAVLSADVRLLEAEIAQRARVEAVRTAATERLGMAPPEQTVRVSVAAQAPSGKPLPERYVARPEPVPTARAMWWERLLRRVPGLE